jgi:hypothetical protein
LEVHLYIIPNYHFKDPAIAKMDPAATSSTGYEIVVKLVSLVFQVSASKVWFSFFSTSVVLGTGT